MHVLRAPRLRMRRHCYMRATIMHLLARQQRITNKFNLFIEPCVEWIQCSWRV